MKPRSGTRLSSPPLLNWIWVENARRYNLQLWRHGAKILSRFPKASRRDLGRTWRYGGRRYRMTPGRYTWYVWPRFAGRYGEMIGKRVFYIRG
jgi:hypothetical protein